MSYLARLKQIEMNKNAQHDSHDELTKVPKGASVSSGSTHLVQFENTQSGVHGLHGANISQHIPCTELTKPPKAPYVSSVSTLQGHHEKNQTMHGSEPIHAEVLAMYPNAIETEQPPERIRIKPTSKQEAELRALVVAVGMAYNFTYGEGQEAIALALNDPDAALQSYRATAPEPGIALDHDDRRHCDLCTNLRRDVCTIAEPKVGALVVANRGYRPVREPPRRCAGYTPGPDDQDRRIGLERWPRLIEEGE